MTRESRYGSGTSLEPSRKEALADLVEARLGELRGEPGFDVGDALHVALAEKLSVGDLKALVEALTPAPKPTPWPAMRELVMRWCQDDGTSDELMDLVGELGFDPTDSDEFWHELDRRLTLAFGPPPGRPRKSRVRGG